MRNILAVSVEAPVNAICTLCCACACVHLALSELQFLFQIATGRTHTECRCIWLSEKI